MLRTLKCFILIVISWFSIFTMIGCGKTETSTGNDQNYKIDSLQIYTIKNELLNATFGINVNNFVIQVDNDGIPGKQFIIKFFYPQGITPKSISPNINNPIDFKNPVQFDISFSENVVKTYIITLTEKPVDESKFLIENISLLTESGSPSSLKLTKSGKDYIGLTQNQVVSSKYKLQIKFPENIKPISVEPDPNIARDYSGGVTFTVKYDEQLTLYYQVKVGNYNTSDFKRDILRGVWVSNVGSDVLSSKSNITECVNICKELGINTIFLVTYNNGKTQYRSDVMREYFGVEIDPVFGNRDPLAEMIEAAKPLGIKVVAWFEYGFASVYGDNTGGPIVAKYPEWASRDVNGKITEKNNFYWLDAFNPDVQEFVKRLMVEVVKKYPDISGVQGDDRLPALASNGGYNAMVTSLYKKETGNNVPSNFSDAQWLKWRADKLSDYCEFIFKHIKSVGGKYMVSWSPSPYSWSLQNYLQDWPEWIRRGACDHIHPQLYRTSFNDYKTVFDQNLGHMSAFASKELIFSPGILVGIGSGDSITPEILDQILAYNRGQGIKGETFFYYERIRKNKGFQDVIKKHNK